MAYTVAQSLLFVDHLPHPHDEARLRAVKRLVKPLVLVVGGIVLAGVVLLLDLARFGGVFRRFETSFAGSCSAVALAGSSEDIQVDREHGIAYLSVLNRASAAGGESLGGTIMLLDLNLAEPAPRAALAYDPQDFRPHGISRLQFAGEPDRLFAISHRSDGTHSVEILEQGASGTFFPKESLRDAAFVHPNALAAAGPRQFYLVNDSDAKGALAKFAEAAFRRGHSTLAYFDGKESRVVAADLAFPAGIALNADGTRLYVGEALAKQLRIYQRNPQDGALILDEIVPLDTAPDNLNVDADGVLWIAAHPKLLAFFRMLHDPAKRAPTQVLRFDPRGPKPAAGEPDARVSQIYADDGTGFSAGTVAARWHDEFLIGALYEPKVLICRPNP